MDTTMKRIVAGLALFASLWLSPSATLAQCTGVFPASTVCGNASTTTAAPPKAISLSTFGPTVYNVQAYGWLCDSTDRSTQAQALINIAGNAGGGTLWFPACTGTNTYRADSKLTFAQLNTNPGSNTSQASLRFTGPGGGMNIYNRKQSWAANSNAAVLDLRYQGQAASGITEVAAVGAGGSDGTRTLTLVGGTFTTAATYSATVIGGAISGTPTLISGGAYTVTPANPVAVTGGGLVGATLTAFWTGGKIQSLGGGTLQIDHLGFIDNGSSNSTPFLYSTNTTMLVNNNTFIGTGNSQQDAIVLGGMKASGFINPPEQNADSPFLGYGTWIDSNDFEGLNRAVYVRTFGNEVKITNNIANVCAGDRFIEWHGKVAIESSGGIVTGNYTEACASLRYGYVLNNSVTNTVFSGNAVWDVNANPNFISDYYLVTSNAAGNTFILGHHDGSKAIFSGSTDAINSSIIIGALTNFYQPASGNSSFSAQFQGLLVGGYYGATNNPHGQLAIVSSLDAGAGSLQLSVDPTNSVNHLDSVNLAGSGAGLPLKINSHGATTQFGGFVQLLGATTAFPGFKRSASSISFRLADDSADAAITAFDVTGSGTIRGNAGFNANGTAGASGTVSVRKGDDSAACNLVFSLGLYISTTC